MTSFVVFSPPNSFLFISPQVCVWSWGAWSTPTAGTATRCGGCAGSRRISTAWGLAPCAGPTSWPSWASWTLWSCPSWPLSWGTDRMDSWQKSCWLRARVRTSCPLESKCDFFYFFIIFFYVQLFWEMLQWESEPREEWDSVRDWRKVKQASHLPACELKTTVEKPCVLVWYSARLSGCHEEWWEKLWKITARMAKMT